MYKNRFKLVKYLLICTIIFSSIVSIKYSLDIGVFSDPPGLGEIIESVSLIKS